jgi:hypothetical protein
VLQSRFVIVRGSVRYWDEETLANIMKTCIIIHNMIIEDEGAMNLVPLYQCHMVKYQN